MKKIGLSAIASLLIFASLADAGIFQRLFSRHASGAKATCVGGSCRR